MISLCFVLAKDLVTYALGIFLYFPCSFDNKKNIITFKFVPWDDLPSEMFCVFHSNSNKGVVGCVAAREYMCQLTIVA